MNDRLEQSIDILKSIVEAERLKRSGADLTAKDTDVLAIADRALRAHMMQEVERFSQHSSFFVPPPLRSEL